MLLLTGMRAVHGSHRSLHPTLVGWFPLRIPGRPFLAAVLVAVFEGNSALVAGTGGSGCRVLRTSRRIRLRGAHSTTLVGTGVTVTRRPQWDRM